MRPCQAHESFLRVRRFVGPIHGRLEAEPMTANPLAILGIILMALALLLVPVGLPGTWVMVAVLAVGAYFGVVGVPVFLGCIALALLAELAEYWVAQRVNVRYGGSSRAFWGAILGGFIGVVVGIPVPIIGSIIAGVLGSFAGAFVVSYAETRGLVEAGLVGWGTVVARVLSAGFKTAIGLAILVLGAASLLIP